MKSNATFKLQTLKSIVAVLLIVPSMVFGQQKEGIKSGEIKVKIVKDENGKKSERMKTFSLDEEDQMKEFLKEVGVDFKADSLMNFYKYETKSGVSENIDIQIDSKKGTKDGEESNVQVFKYEINIDEDDHSKANKSGSNTKDVRFFKFHIDEDEGQEIDEELIKKLKSLDNKEVDEIIELMKSEGANVSVNKKVFVKTIEIDDIDGDIGAETMIFIKKESDATDTEELPKSILEKFDPTSTLEELSLFPNPTSDKVKLGFISKEKKDYQLSILDAKGSAVYEKNLSNFKGKFNEEIDLSSYENGIYFFKLISENEQLVKKIVVQ